MAALLNKYSGSLIMDATAKTATIPAVAMANTTTRFSVSNNSNRPDNSQVRIELTNSTTLTFFITASNPNVIVEWDALEFDSSVNVQRGIVQVTNNVTTITISSVSVNDTYVTLTGGIRTFSAYGDNDIGRYELTSSTELTLYFQGNFSMYYGYEVVEYTDAADINVQRGSAVLTSLSTTTATFSAVTLSDSMALSSLELAITPLAAPSLTGVSSTFNSTTEIALTRGASSADVCIAGYEIIEFLDGTTVQSGSISFGTTDLILTATVSVLDQTTSSVFLSHNQGGGQSWGRTGYAADDYTGVAMFNAKFNSNTQIELERGIHQSSTAEAPWYTVEWNTGTGGITASVDVSTAAFTGTAIANTDYVASTDTNNSAQTLLAQGDTDYVINAVADNAAQTLSAQGIYTPSGSFSATVDVSNSPGVVNAVFDAMHVSQTDISAAAAEISTASIFNPSYTVTADVTNPASIINVISDANIITDMDSNTSVTLVSIVADSAHSFSVDVSAAAITLASTVSYSAAAIIAIVDITSAPATLSAYQVNQFLYNVYVQVLHQDDSPAIGVVVTAAIDRQDKCQNMPLYSEPSEEITDSNGQATLKLMPNILGDDATQYIVTALDDSGEKLFFKVVAVVPKSDSNLFDIATLEC